SAWPSICRTSTRSSALDFRPTCGPSMNAKPVARDPCIRVLIPTIPRSYTGGLDTIEIAATAGGGLGVTLADAMAALDQRYPGIRFRIIDEQGHVRPHIKMFIDGDVTRDLSAALPANSTLMIVGALSGG